MGDGRPTRAERLFRSLLRLLPFDFRRNYGDEMAGVLQDHHDAVRGEGTSAMARFWVSTVHGLLRLASREHWIAWRQDLRSSSRLLRQSPGFTVAATLSLALGIGANSAVFGVADAVFLNPLPIPDPDRAVAVFVVDRQNPGHTPLSTDNFRDVRDQATALTDVAAYSFLAARTRLAGEPQNMTGLVVSGHYFDALGIEARLGRLLGADDDRIPGGHAVIVLSHELWTRGFNGDAGVVGRTITLNDRPFTVVGVAPAAFSGTFGLFRPDFYVPLAMYDAMNPGTAWVEGRRWRWLSVIARLAPGVSLDEANAATRAIGDRLAQTYPDVNEGRSLAVLPLETTVINADQHAMLTQAWWILAGVVAALLLIACTNLANLLIARNAARAREIAVRLSLGASRGRVLRQLMTESALLALLGGAVSLVLVYVLYGWFWDARPQALEQLSIRPGVNLSAVLFTFLVSAVTAVFFGLVPALQVLRCDLSRTLADGGRTPAAAIRPRLRAALVAGQVALATVALVVAGLFLGSLARARAIDPGFDYEHLYSSVYTTSRAGSIEETHAFHEALVARAAQIPGVRAAATADRLPIGVGPANTIDRVLGSPVADAVSGTLVDVAEVGPGYFDTAGIRLLAGRDFDARDRLAAPTVAIINRTMAERFWPGMNALGQRFITRASPTPIEVIGIAADSKYQALGEAPQPFFYLPVLQGRASGVGGRFLLVSATDAADLAPAIGAILRSLDPNMPVNDVVSAREQLGQALWAPRMLATVVTAFGALALALASAGIYGLLAVSVSQRRHEFGLRMTLGASPRDVLGLVVGRGMRWVSAGLLAGLAGALMAIELTRSLLFAPEGLGPTAMTGAVSVLAAVAFLACVFPARRAARVDPASALRGDPVG